MATRNIPAPSNPYASGAVVFDSTPYTEFYIREQQKEQAKDEALDKYFQEWDKSINPAGMRNIDTQDFLNLVNENKDYYFKNKAAIKNPALDGGKAYSEWNARGKSAMGLVSQSKNAAAKEAEYGKMILKAKQDGLPIPESTLKLIEQYRQAIKSPNWRDINPEELDFIPKKFDPLSFGEKVWKGIPFNTKVEKIPSKEEGYFDEVTTQVVPKDAYDAIRRKAYTEYENDATTKYAVDLASTNPSEFQRYNDIFQKQYGDKIRSKGDLATAIALEFSPIGKGETKEKASRDEKYWFRQAEAGKNKRAAMMAAEKDAEPIVDVWGGIVDAVGKSKTGAIAFNELEPDAQEILLSFAKKSGKDLSQEDVTVYKNPKGGYELREVVNITDKSGNIISSKVGGLITPINRQVVNLQGQPSVQEKRKVIGGGKSSQKSAKKYKGLDKNGNPIFE
jgi:hypothetical protein